MRLTKAIVKLAVFGSILLQGTSQAQTFRKITITGAEQTANGTADHGSVTLSVNLVQKTVLYGALSTPASIASGLAAAFSADCTSPANARANGSTITLKARNGALTQAGITSQSDLTIFPQSSFSQDTTVFPAPVLTSVSPASAAVGTPVTLTGSNFGANPLYGYVFFNGVLGTPTTWNDGTITVPVPVGATSGPLVVGVGSSPSNSFAFTVSTAAVSTGTSQGPGIINTLATSGIGNVDNTQFINSKGDLIYGATVTGFHRVSAADGSDQIVTPIPGSDPSPFNSKDDIVLALPVPSNIGIYVLNTVSGILTLRAGGGYQNHYGTPAIGSFIGYVPAITIDDLGNIYFISQTTYNLITKSHLLELTTDGNFTGLVEFSDFYARNIVVDNAKKRILYIDSLTNQLKGYDLGTQLIDVLAGNGSSTYTYDQEVHPALSSPLFGPTFVGVDTQGVVYISENSGIRKFDPASGTIIPVAGNGVKVDAGDGGLALNASIADPGSLLVDLQGTLYINDAPNLRVVGSTPFPLEQRRVPTVTWATPQPIAYGTALSTIQLNATADVSGTFTYTPAAGIVLAGGIQTLSVAFTPADTATYSGVTQSVSLNVISTKVGLLEPVSGSIGGGAHGGDGGVATSAYLDQPSGVASDSLGNIFIADSVNCRIRKITKSTGIITTVAGQITGGGPLTTLYNAPVMCGYTGDGGLAISAQLSNPTAVIVDNAGNLFIADTGNNVIRRVDGSSGNITTLAGSGVAGFAGDGGPASSAQFNFPLSLAFDSQANLYVADSNNHKLRRIDSSGNISTIAGTGTSGISGDGGPAASAQLSFPSGVTVNGTGDIFVADSGNSLVRRISGGTISTVTGDGVAGYAGDGGPANSARLDYPSAVLTNSQGDLYIADAGNNTVRLLHHASGLIETIAGYQGSNAVGLGGVATSVPLSSPSGLALAPTGDLYIADTGDDRVVAIHTGDLPPITITWPQLSYASSGTYLSEAQLNATASVPGTFTYSPGTGNFLQSGTVTITLTFTPADSKDYAPIVRTQTLYVEPGCDRCPVVNWPAPAPIAYGTPLSAVQLNASSSMPGTFTYNPGAGTVLDAGTQVLSVHYQETNYSALVTTDLTVPIIVTPASSLVLLSTSANPTNPEHPTTLSAAVSGTTTGSVVFADGGTTIGTSPIVNQAASLILPKLAAGTHSLTASVTGDQDHAAANSAVLSQVVQTSQQTLIWNTPQPITAGTPLSAVQLNASIQEPGSIAYTPSAGTILTTGQHTLLATFTPFSSVLSSQTASVQLQVTDGAPAPQITSIFPETAARGAQVTLTGTNFGSSPGAIQFQGGAASIVSWSPTSIVAIVPGGAATGDVSVNQGATQSNGYLFLVTTPCRQ